MKYPKFFFQMLTIFFAGLSLLLSCSYASPFFSYGIFASISTSLGNQTEVFALQTRFHFCVTEKEELSLPILWHT